jgi:hypothetical protein
MPDGLGYIDLEQKTVPYRQPFRLEIVTHVLGTESSPCLRVGPRKPGAGEGIRTLDPNLGKRWEALLCSSIRTAVTHF